MSQQCTVLFTDYYVRFQQLNIQNSGANNELKIRDFYFSSLEMLHWKNVTVSCQARYLLLLNRGNTLFGNANIPHFI